jgi:hypothetical protein
VPFVGLVPKNNILGHLEAKIPNFGAGIGNASQNVNFEKAQYFRHSSTHFRHNFT